MPESEATVRPELAQIIRVKEETPSIKTFTIRFLDKRRQKKFSFVPGKFMAASVLGYGEMAISISSSPYQKHSLQLTVNKVGNTSNAMHSLRAGDIIGLKGPLGRGYPIQRFRKKNIVFFSGGCGFAPLRSAVYAINAKKEMFGKLFVFHGCKNPEEMLFKEDLERWKEEKHIETFISFDSAPKGTKEHIGFVTDLIDNANIPAQNTIVLMCGPPIMMNIAMEKFKKKGFKAEQFFVSIERKMFCGVGKCEHCNIGKEHVCIKGPVFTGIELEKMHLKED